MYTLCRIPFKITLLIDCVNSKMILSTKLIFDRPLYNFIDFKIIFINNFFSDLFLMIRILSTSK